MSHHIYTTEAFVIDSTPFGEANSFIHLFTRNLGFISASARSVRVVKSKLRYGLQDFSHSTVALVRGKYEWKITNVVPHDNVYYTNKNDHNVLAVCTHALALIKKLVVGEEKNEILFDIILNAFSFLQSHTLTSKELFNAECILMLRLIENLGYLRADILLKQFTKDTHWNIELITDMAQHQRHAVVEINNAIKESQL